MGLRRRQEPQGQRVPARRPDQRRTCRSPTWSTRPCPTDAQFRAKYGKGNPAEFDLSEIDWDQSGRAPEPRGRGRGPDPQPARGRRVGPAPPERLLLRSPPRRQRHRRPDRPTVGRDGCGPLAHARGRTSSSPSSAARSTLLLDGSEAPFLNKPDNIDDRPPRQPPAPGGPGRQRPPRRGSSPTGIAYGARGVAGDVRPGAVPAGEAGIDHQRRGVQRHHRHREHPRRRDRSCSTRRSTSPAATPRRSRRASCSTIRVRSW